MSVLVATAMPRVTRPNAHSLHERIGAGVVSRKSIMSDGVLLVAFIVAWLVLQLWLLPRLGVST